MDKQSKTHSKLTPRSNVNNPEEGLIISDTEGEVDDMTFTTLSKTSSSKEDLSQKPYKISISLNVLNHLGIGLYSNIPAVLSEVVANSWDADATIVRINIDRQNNSITIYDDGVGMTLNDINNKFLNVGYQKRLKEPGLTKQRNRQPMGRKGIGKLAVFSIANTVEIYSVKDSERNAFSMNAKEIEEEAERQGIYFPKPLEINQIDFERGTKIVLRDLKKNS